MDILASADVLAAEDTRSVRKLMDIHGILLGGRPLLVYHDHSGARVRQRLMADLGAGRSIAYASEAGTPLVSDPGFGLARAAAEAGHKITSAPGASAVLAALTIAGLPTDAFFFAGFLPNTQTARQKRLAELKDVPGTLVFYESPKRLGAMLRDAATALGGDRQAAMCRELTKRFESIRRDTLGALAAEFADTSVKGEVVVLVDRGCSEKLKSSDIILDLSRAMQEMSVKDAADLVSKAHGLPRRKVYQLALKLGKGVGT